MHPTKTLISGLVVVALVAAPLSSASAAWRHRGLVPDLFGAAAAVIVGAATIATAPLAIIAGADPRGYYGGPGDMLMMGARARIMAAPRDMLMMGLRAGIMLPRQPDITLHPAIMVRHPTITPRDPSITGRRPATKRVKNDEPRGASSRWGLPNECVRRRDVLSSSVSLSRFAPRPRLSCSLTESGATVNGAVIMGQPKTFAFGAYRA